MKKGNIWARPIGGGYQREERQIREPVPQDGSGAILNRFLNNSTAGSRAADWAADTFRAEGRSGRLVPEGVQEQVTVENLSIP
jgi:hypothetical protein